MALTPLRTRVLLLLLLLAHLALATAYSVLNPLGEAPDEVDHWSYIIFLAREQRLPDTPKLTQGKHPPLYHAAAALIANVTQPPAFKFLRANPDLQLQPDATSAPNFFIHTTLENWPWQEGALAFHIVRLWSVLLSTATLVATYGLARTAFPRQPSLALTTVGVLAFLPEFAFIGGAVNNDNAAALFGTLALWGGFAIYQADGRFSAGWWTPLALGLGLLAKVSTLALWGVIGCAILLGTMRQETGDWGLEIRTWLRYGGRTWRRWVGTGLWVFVPALLIGSPWLLRNWQLYGDPLGMALVRQTVDLRTTPWTWADTGWLARGWFVSFWGKFGGAGQIPLGSWLYTLLAILTGCSGLGLLIHWRTQRTARLPLALLGLAGASVALSMWQYSLIALGTDQGRLLYPAIAPLIMLFIIGLLAWLPAIQMGKPGAMLVLGSLLLGLYGLLGVIQPTFAPPSPVTPEQLAHLPTASPLHFGELTLTRWTLQDNPVLYWTAQQPTNQDWRTWLRVVTENNRVVWEWRRSPSAGRWSTDHWPSGIIVRDAYTIHWPDWAGAGRYRVEIGAQPFDSDLVVPAGAQGTTPDQPFATLGWLERPKP